MSNEWKDINGYNGRYQISNDGQVRNIKTNRFIKGGLVSKGYFLVSLSYKTRIEKIYIHRLVAIYFINNPEKKPHVNHINGNMKDNRMENLEWCTPKENIQHAYRIGLVPTSIKAKQGGKISEDQVLEIRSSSLPKKMLAQQYNLHIESINNIVLRKTWKHI